MPVPQLEAYSFEDDDTGLDAALETQKALIDTQERLGMMLDVMPIGLLIHTQQGILFANQEACGMLQVGKAEAIGHHVLDFLAPAEFEGVNHQFSQSFVNPSAMYRLETAIVRRDGSVISIKLLSCKLPWQGTPVIQVLLQDVTDLKLKEERLRLLTITDELTGAFNRRHLFDVGGVLLDGAVDLNVALSVVSLDIDHFKKINDTYGHAIGDVALKRLSRVAREIISEGCVDQRSMLARLGGEEFLILLPAVSVEAAAALAERLRVAVAAISIEVPGGQVGFTASFGVATYTAGDEGLDGLLSRADAALYEAKRGGRNRVRLA